MSSMKKKAIVYGSIFLTLLVVIMFTSEAQRKRDAKMCINYAFALSDSRVQSDMTKTEMAQSQQRLQRDLGECR